MIRQCRKEIMKNMAIWIVAHNLPLIAALCLDAYFDRNNSVFAVAVIAILGIARIILIKYGAYTDICCQQAVSGHYYDRLLNRMEMNGSKISNAQIENVLNDDVDRIAGAVSYSIDTIANVLYGIIVVSIMAFINIQLTLWILLLPCIAFLLHVVLKKIITSQRERLKETTQQFSFCLNEVFEYGRKIRIQGKEEGLLQSMQEVLDQQNKMGIGAGLLTGTVTSVSGFLTDASLLVIFAFYLADQTMTPGDLVLFTTYSFDLSGIVQYISSLVLTLFSVKVQQDHFENVMCCDEKKECIKNKNSVQIQQGKVNIIIGENGSGKSTVMEQLWESEEDSVLLPEHVHLFHDTISGNILLNMKKETQDEDIFCVRDLFSHTIDELSGGEKMRVAMARTFAHSKEVILLDNNLLSFHPDLRKRIIEYFIRSKKTIVLTDTMIRPAYDGCYIIQYGKNKNELKKL